MEFFLTQFGIALVTIYLRGLQTHNVIRFEYWRAGFISGAMSVANVALIGLIAHDPYASIIPATLGAVIGIELSMWQSHRKFNNKAD